MDGPLLPGHLMIKNVRVQQATPSIQDTLQWHQFSMQVCACVCLVLCFNGHGGVTLVLLALLDSGCLLHLLLPIHAQCLGQSCIFFAEPNIFPKAGAALLSGNLRVAMQLSESLPLGTGCSRIMSRSR